jgi:predicted metal-dependent phosphoesterase TrpH
MAGSTGSTDSTGSTGSTRSKRSERHRPGAPDGDRVVPPGPSSLDLHSHTARSDGLLEPAALVAAAAAAGVHVLSITDHDTLAGVRELRAGGDLPTGLELLPGIELNAIVGDGVDIRESEVHILGLGVDPDDKGLESTLSRQRTARRVRFDRMVGRLRDLGLPIDAALEQLPAAGDDDALGRPRIARAMIASGYVETVDQAFTEHLSRGRPAYVPREGLGPIGAIQAIRAAGGVPALAHFSEAPQRIDLLRQLMDCVLLGLEVYHRSHDAPTVRSLERVAAELGLAATGGSDYHGDRESYAEAHAHLWVPPEVEAPLRAAMHRASALHGSSHGDVTTITR